MYSDYAKTNYDALESQNIDPGNDSNKTSFILVKFSMERDIIRSVSK